MNVAAPAPTGIIVGDRTIGPGRPVYVIAEAGVNHDGSVEKAMALIDAAVEAKADAVKFQMFRAGELASREAGAAAYQREAGATSQYEMLRRLELTEDEFRRLRDYCRGRGIEFLATPFGRHDVARLTALDVKAFKLASTDLNNVPLVRRVVETGLPMIVSTGASSHAEIAASVERLREAEALERLILLHCVSAYPTPLSAANLRAVTVLRAEFGVASGFSDHTTDVRTGAWAAAVGACVIEKHFTLDKTAAGPDHAMSLSPEQLREYVRGIRDLERALGVGDLNMNAIERDVRLIARKSVVAACDISAGAVLTPEHLCVKRPGDGIEPAKLEELLGRRVLVDVPKDSLLTWDMIQ